MKMSLTEQELSHYVAKQLGNFFPDQQQHSVDIDVIINKALQRIGYCFGHIHRKYYQALDDNGKSQTLFNHLNSDHYASFLYVLSNQAWRENKITLAEKLFYLNKALNGFDCFYSVELPKIFMLVHPVGTVLGNAKYQDYLVVYQNVTVGSTLSGQYPEFSQGCVLYSKSSVIGNCHIGENVIVGANAFILNCDIDSQHSVVGQHPEHRATASNIDVIHDVFS
jgi:serine O-acetyltransferase